MPSLILYSCPQLPQTSFPSLTDVSRRRVCRSRIVFSSSVEGGVSVGTSAVGGGDKDEESRADDEDAGGSGFDSGIVKPSYWDLISRGSLSPQASSPQTEVPGRVLYTPRRLLSLQHPNPISGECLARILGCMPFQLPRARHLGSGGERKRARICSS